MKFNDDDDDVTVRKTISDIASDTNYGVKYKKIAGPHASYGK